MTINELRKLIIFDLDGTLVDVTSIRYHVEGKHRNYDKFHSESLACPPYKEVLSLNNALKKSPENYIAILTGREEKYRSLSEQWLRMNNVSYSTLLMRQNKDFRKNVEVKKEIYDSIKVNFSPYIAIDDTSELRDLWRDLGFELVYDPMNFDHNQG